MREALFVVNPATVRHLRAFRRHCHEAAAAHGWRADLVVTLGGEGSQLLHARLESYLAAGGERLVFAVGGDGTVRACAHNLAGTGVPLAVVPRGTANLFAHALRLPHSLGEALATGFAGADRRIDIAVADDEPCVAMAGVGIDAAVVQSTPRWFKEHLGWAGYALAALPHLASAPSEVRIRLDGGPPLVRVAQAVVVGNVGILPGGFSLLPGGSMDDGLLEVGVLTPVNLVDWLSVARQAVSGRRWGAPRVEHYRAAEVAVTANAALPRQVDGDVVRPSSSLTVTARPRALVLRSPE